MEETQGTQTTLRDQIAAQVDALETVQDEPQAPAAAPGPSADEVVGGANPPAQSDGDDQKPGRTAGRLRDEQGRLLPGKAERPPEIPPQVAEAAKPGAGLPPPVVTPAAEPAVAHPSSWKKEMWGEWAKLPPTVQQYINQRESEYARGVSTYRQEYENAKPIVEAMHSFMPLLQQHNIEPGQWITNLGNAHRMLAMGSPQEKVGIFARLAREYGVPIEQMLVRGQDGEVYVNKQLEQYVPSQPQPQVDVNSIIETKLVEREAQQAARQFVEAKDATGNPVHPHFETVRETMSQLLAAGIAQDLESAYDAALRLPQHSHLYEQIQQQKAAQDEAKKQAGLAARAGLARQNAVSPRSATPASKGGGTTAKGIRGALEEAFDSHVPGRV